MGWGRWGARGPVSWRLMMPSLLRSSEENLRRDDDALEVVDFVDDLVGEGDREGDS